MMSGPSGLRTVKVDCLLVTLVPIVVVDDDGFGHMLS